MDTQFLLYAALGISSISLLLLAIRTVQPVERRATAAWPHQQTKSASVSRELEQALEDAVKMNSYSVGDVAGPTLAASLRFSPADYVNGSLKLAKLYKQNRVIAVELDNLEAKQAVRLVDYCSGLAAGSNGWIFRSAGRALILIPPSE